MRFHESENPFKKTLFQGEEVIQLYSVKIVLNIFNRKTSLLAITNERLLLNYETRIISINYYSIKKCIVVENHSLFKSGKSLRIEYIEGNNQVIEIMLVKHVSGREDEIEECNMLINTFLHQ